MIMKYKKKKIFKLDEVEEERVSVFALVSQAKDYKLSWHLNKLLSIDLQKDKNYICRGKSFFSRFKFLESEKYGSLTLTSNNSGKGYLETTQKKINYFQTIILNTHMIIAVVTFFLLSIINFTKYLIKEIY